VVLARRYEAALLTIDGVVLDAIANGNSPAGLKARAMCAEAARKRAEEMKMMEGEEEKKPVGLSVEAVTAHAQGLLFFHHFCCCCFFALFDTLSFCVRQFLFLMT
jgi:hydrocephalus-inducing protein